MLNLPSDFKTKKYINNIKPISGYGLNEMYKWGRNCRILYKDNISTTVNILNSIEYELSSESYDEFWEGYYYGIEKII